MRARLVPSRLLVATLSAVVLGAGAGGAFGCDRDSAPRPSASRSPGAPAEPTPLEVAPTEPAGLCERFADEHAELELGAPLRRRIEGLPAAAAAWMAQEPAPDPGARRALQRLLEAPADAEALAALHPHALAFASAPSLLVDATLRSLLAIDAVATGGDNTPTVSALARAREWHPSEPSVPWIEALLLPERGGRRRLLAEAHAAGGDDPALLLALARAALRDGDSRAAVDLVEAARASRGPGAAQLGRALQERAALAERARATQRTAQHAGVEVRAPRALGEGALTNLARVVRADLDDAGALLEQPPRASLSVWVHADLDALRAATCGSSWSQALYDGVLHVALATGELDARVRQSLRHEALHAQLDDATPLAPRWFHEGVAQRFAGEPLEEPGPRVTLSAAALNETERALALSAPGATAGEAYDAARALVEALVSRDGERALPAIVAALRAGLSPRELGRHLRLVDSAPTETLGAPFTAPERGAPRP